MDDMQIRLTEPIYEERIDSGGMFDDRLLVYVFTDGEAKPYLALAQDGWGRGVGNRYSTLEEAKSNLNRLHEKLRG
jgi:hypothetical protein